MKERRKIFVQNLGEKKCISSFHNFSFIPEGVHQDDLQLSMVMITIVSIYIFCQSFKIIPDAYEVMNAMMTMHAVKSA